MKPAGALLALLLAACSQSPAPAPRGNDAAQDIDLAADPMRTSIIGPDHRVAAAILPAPEIEGVGIAPGKWQVDRAPGGDAALFGSGPGGPIFGLRCDVRGGRMVFVRARTPGGSGMMRIVTSTGAAAFVAAPRRFAPGVMATAPIGDVFLSDVLARATGKIGIQLGSAPAIIVPADRLIGEVIRGCIAARAAQSS